MLFFLGQSSLGFLPRPYWLHLTQCRLSRLLIWLDERMETRMLKYTMLHTTGYQKPLYDKEYTHHTWNLIINTCHLWGSQWPSVHFLPGPVIFSYLGGNSEEQLLKTDGRPTGLPSLLTINFHHLSPDCWPTVCEVLVMVNCGWPVGKSDMFLKKLIKVAYFHPHSC